MKNATIRSRGGGPGNRSRNESVCPASNPWKRSRISVIASWVVMRCWLTSWTNSSEASRSTSRKASRRWMRLVSTAGSGRSIPSCARRSRRGRTRRGPGAADPQPLGGLAEALVIEKPAHQPRARVPRPPPPRRWAGQEHPRLDLGQRGGHHEEIPRVVDVRVPGSPQ